MSNANAKKASGYYAADLIESGMKVGLGTGSTAFYFIERLVERVQGGLKIKAIATSKKSTEQAKRGGIDLIDSEDVTSLDIDVDGADEIDSDNNMIKGGGGALLREKIIANASHKMFIIVDSSKVVSKLGECKLPLELVPFGLLTTIRALKELGYSGEIRKDSNQNEYKTDNGNLIIDLDISNREILCESLDLQLKKIPAVIETGLFYNIAKKVIIGYEDGHVEVK